MAENQALKTFIIYARDDKAYKDQLLRHLRPLVSSGYLNVWHDGDIMPGEDWEKKIKANLKTSQLVLVLVSVNCLNSDFIEGDELETAVSQLRDGHTRIVPIIISPCGWRFHKLFVGLQGLPEDMKPVSNWSNPDQAWTEVVESLAKIVEDTRAEQAASDQQQREKEEQEKLAVLAAERASRERAAEAERERIAQEQRDHRLAEQQRLAEAQKQQLSDFSAQKAAAEHSSRLAAAERKQQVLEQKGQWSKGTYNTWIGIGAIGFLAIVLMIWQPWKSNEDPAPTGNGLIDKPHNQPDLTLPKQDSAGKNGSLRPLRRDQIEFDHARQTGTVKGWEQFIRQYPDSPLKQEALKHSRVAKLIQEADEYLKIYEPDLAIQSLNKAHAMDPDNRKITDRLEALKKNRKN